MGKSNPWLLRVGVALIVVVAAVLFVVRLQGVLKERAEEAAKQAQLDELMAKLKAQQEQIERDKREHGPTWKRPPPPPKPKIPCECQPGDPLCSCE